MSTKIGNRLLIGSALITAVPLISAKANARTWWEDIPAASCIQGSTNAGTGWFNVTTASDSDMVRRLVPGGASAVPFYAVFLCPTPDRGHREYDSNGVQINYWLQTASTVTAEDVVVYNDNSGFGTAVQTCYRSINGQAYGCSDYAWALAAGNQQILLTDSYLNPFKNDGFHYTWVTVMGASGRPGFVGISYSGTY